METDLFELKFKNAFLVTVDGKICLDVLRMPPGGSYNPAITLESILLSIQLLLASPNPDDPLRDDISDEYRYNRELFNKNAKKLSGFDEPEAGHSNKRMKADTEEIPGRIIKQTVDKDEINDFKSDPKPNTSNESEAATELAPVSSAKSNRKRKHDEMRRN